MAENMTGHCAFWIIANHLLIDDHTRKLFSSFLQARYNLNGNITFDHHWFIKALLMLIQQRLNIIGIDLRIQVI
jgi:hypothetical protein